METVFSRLHSKVAVRQPYTVFSGKTVAGGLNRVSPARNRKVILGDNPVSSRRLNRQRTAAV